MASKTSTEERLGRIAVGIFGFVWQVLLGFLNAALVMLGLGAAHDEWPNVPAVGYWGCFAMVLGISALAGAIHGGMRIKIKND